MAIVEMTVDMYDVRGTLSFAEIGCSKSRSLQASAHDPGVPPTPAGCISTSTTFEHPHPDHGKLIRMTYYSPNNPKYTGGLPQELPPAIVRLCDGCVRAAGLDWEVQLYTTRGFAW